MLRLRQPVANPTGAHNCVVAYTPLWWTGEEASWCLLQPKYTRGNSTAVAASSQAVHRTAEAVLTSLRYSHSTNSTTSLMSCTFDLWWQLYSSCLKLPHVAAVIRPREVPPASNLTRGCVPAPHCRPAPSAGSDRSCRFGPGAELEISSQ